jgi:beta-lactam-binding protein with PASTA domain
MATIEITEGWTGSVDLQLQADGAVFDLTGKEVALIKRSACGVEFVATTSGSQFEHVSSTCGIVRYTPSSGDLLVSDQPYWVKVRVSSGTTKVYFPNGAGDTWTVYSQ